MIYQYAVTLRNTSSRYVDRISLWLLLISVALFLREPLNGFDRKQLIFLAAALLIAGIVIRNFMLRKRNPGQAVFYRPALYAAAVGWIFMPYQAWLFVPLVLMAMFERQAKMPLEIGFTDDAVVINTLFRRYYRWADFNNIVLKDDILTLDFKNNRLLQRETVDEEGEAGEDEFNDYCRERLAKAHSALS